jgi:hypothetical protein
MLTVPVYLYGDIGRLKEADRLRIRVSIARSSLSDSLLY